MHLVGLDHVSRFLLKANAEAADAVLALVSELRHRNWKKAEEMARAFREADFDLPMVTYWLLGHSVAVRCWIDFATRTVLIDDCASAANMGSVTSRANEKDAAR